jgi:prevent-host-death family protein
MDSVVASEAKTHLAELLNRVARGEKITITRRGVPVAMLIPIEGNQEKVTHREIVEGMRALRKKVKRSKMTVRDLVEEGRRY